MKRYILLKEITLSFKIDSIEFLRSRPNLFLVKYRDFDSIYVYDWVSMKSKPTKPRANSQASSSPNDRCLFEYVFDSDYDDYYCRTIECFSLDDKDIILFKLVNESHVNLMLSFSILHNK